MANSLHLQGFISSPAPVRRMKTLSNLDNISVADFAKATMSLKKIGHVCHCSPYNTVSSNRSKVEGASHRSNGITFHWKSPLRVVKTDFNLASSVNPTCQYPLSKSSVENYLAPPNDSIVSSMRGHRYASHLVTALSCL